MPGSLIGPRLLGDIRKTISVVHGEFGKEDVVKIPTATIAGGGSGVQLVTFTGAWSIGSLKTVTFHGSTNTASVSNLLENVGVDCGQRYAAIFRTGGSWQLLKAQCS